MLKTSALVLLCLTAVGCIDERRPQTDPEPTPRPEAAPSPGPEPAPDASEPDAPEPAPVMGDPEPLPPGIDEPAFHRPAAEDCDDVRAMGRLFDDPDAACQTDADCADGHNGRCHRAIFATCTYDECLTDDECANEAGGTVCGCEAGWINGRRGDNNVCLQGDCQVDADCETGYCSPSYGRCGGGRGVVAYYCHTFEDECIDDIDCGARGLYCAFLVERGRWGCDDRICEGK